MDVDGRGRDLLERIGAFPNATRSWICSGCRLGVNAAKHVAQLLIYDHTMF